MATAPAPPTATKAGNPFAALKKAPPVVWLGAGGVAIGLTYAVLRDRNTPPVTEVPLSAEPGPQQYESLGVPAAPLGYVQGPIVSEPAETVGAVGQTALETLAEMYGTLIPLLIASIERQAAQPPPAPQPIPGGGPPPPPAPAPPPNPVPPKPSLPPGYNAGPTITETSPKKTFPGAIGWARIASGGAGSAHWIDYHVRYTNKLQRWRYRPNVSPKRWDKIWEGAA